MTTSTDKRHRRLLFHLALAVFMATVSTHGVAVWAHSPQGEEPQDTSNEEALSRYTMGVFLLEQGAYQGAIPHLRSAWEMSHNPEIGQKLAETYFRVGDLDSCEELLDVMERGAERSPDLLILRARLRYAQNRNEDALKALLKLRESGQPSFDVERMIARIYAEAGRDQEALEAYERVLRIDGSVPYVHYRHGMLLNKVGRRSEAIAALEEAARLDPSFPEYTMELSRLLVDDGQTDQAVAVLQRLLDRDETNTEARLALANLYVEQERLQDAIRLIEQRDDPGRPHELDLLLGRLYYETGDFERSLDIFESLYDEATGSAELARVLGEIALKANKADRALSYFRRAIDAGPDDYRNYLALFFASSSRFSEDEATLVSLSHDEALELLAAASARVDPGDFDANYLLGLSLQSVEAYGDAGRHLLRAVKIDPTSDRAVLNLASVLERLGEYEAAEPHLAALYDRKPDDPTVCNFYGYLLALLKKDLQKAEELVLTALRTDPDNGYYTDSLGWVYYQRGEFEKAVSELERASELAGDDPVILEHLGDAYVSLNRLKDALDAYERSRGLQKGNESIESKIDETRRRLGE